MKILFVTTNDAYGGAALSAVRLAQSISLNKSITVDILVRDKFSLATTVHQVHPIYRIKSKILSLFSRFVSTITDNRLSTLPIGAFKLSHYANIESYDVIHLHWINACFVNIGDLENIKIPIVWTAHDAWPFQFYHHLPSRTNLFIGNIFRKNMDILRHMNKIGKIHYVTPSKHLAAYANTLGFVNVHVIPNQLETFDKVDTSSPAEKNFIGFITASPKSDPNKGLEKFLQIAEQRPDLSFRILGGDKSLERLNVSCIPFTKDRSEVAKFLLSLDKLLVLSGYENFPGVAVEALQCGTVIIGFSSNPGINEIVSMTEAGRTVHSIEEMISCLDDDIIIDKEKIDRLFALCESSAQRHVALYKGLLD